MKDLKTVCVLGHFAEGKTLLNGQTIKTKIVTEELQRQFGESDVVKIDTHGGWKTLLKAPFQAFRALKKAENVIIFPAHNGVRIYVPLLALLRKLFRGRKLHYSVIGGWLPEFLESHKRLVKRLRAFDGIYVETEMMKKKLEEQGLKNASVIPNCKKLEILDAGKVKTTENPPYRVCTFSRVMKEKGIEDAMNAVSSINNKNGRHVFLLDIYGQIDADQTEWFDALKKSFPEYIRYNGLVAFDKSVEVLSEYDALLFPTYYEGEGFAGTIIDAFASGVPVIASDWRYNSELVKPYTTGILVKCKDPDELVSALQYLCENIDKWNEMKQECIKEADRYLPENALKELLVKIKDGERK